MRKRILPIVLICTLLAMMFTVTIANASPKAEEVDSRAQIVEKYGSEFPVDSLTDEQIEAILTGEPLDVEIDGGIHHFNPENRPSVSEEEAAPPIGGHEFSNLRSKTTKAITVLNREAEIERRFPDGVPDILPEEELDYVLAGGYLRIETPDCNYTFNPENDPTMPPAKRAATTVWNEDMGKSNEWWPDTAHLSYTTGFLFWSVSTGIRYTVPIAPGNFNPMGRVWTKIEGTSGRTAQRQSEYVSWENNRPDVSTSVSLDGDSTATRIYFAYRDLVTNWVRNIEIY